MNRRPLLAAVLVLLLLAGVGVFVAMKAKEANDDLAKAWALIAPAMTVHTCDAPPAEAYSSRDVHYVHRVGEGRIAMATPSASGESTLLGVLEPVGSLTWSPEGCEVGPLRTRSVTVHVVDSQGEPIDAHVGACTWMPLVETTGGKAVLDVPPAVRCKLSAHVVGDTTFRKAPAMALPDDLDEVTLTVGDETHSIEVKRETLRKALSQLGNRPARTAYDRAIKEADNGARTVLSVWKAQYRTRQKAALAQMSELADSDDGWLILNR